MYEELQTCQRALLANQVDKTRLRREKRKMRKLNTIIHDLDH